MTSPKGTAAALLVVAAAGCAAPPAAPLATATPVEDPYTVSSLSGDSTEAAVPRVPGWSDAQHLRAVDDLVAVWLQRDGASPVLNAVHRDDLDAELSQATSAAPGRAGDALEFGADRITLRGPAPLVGTLKRFLAERRAAATASPPVAVELAARLVRLPRSQVPMPTAHALLRSPPRPLVAAVLPGAAPALPGGEVVFAPRLLVADGQAAAVTRETIPLAMVRSEAGDDLTLEADPEPAGVTLGARVAVSDGALVGRVWASLLVPPPEQEPRALPGGYAALACSGVRLDPTRFALREGETLWLVLDDLAHEDEVVVLTLRWRRAQPLG